jgi:hypothetical protein
MISRVIFASTILLIGLNLYSQQPASVQVKPLIQQSVAKATDTKPPSDLNNDVSMQDWIVKADTRAERMSSLGIESAFAEEWNSEAMSGFTVYPRFKSFRIGADRHAAVLFLPCTTLPTQTARLYLLIPDNHMWKVTDHLELDCHYDYNVTFEIASIRDPQRDEILIHHVCVGHGTGYLVQVFYIYSVNGQKLKLELQADELRHEFPIGISPLELSSNSIFTMIPVAGSRSWVIEETCSQNRNGKFTVQRRQFRWNPARARYEPSPFTLVEAAAH